MKESTIKRIVRNAVDYDIATRIGCYTYRINPADRSIVRCKTDCIGVVYIRDDGSRFDRWETVVTDVDMPL